MTRLTWSEPNTRVYESGLDRGVLYPKNGPPVPWNGLTAVDESGGESSNVYFIDGRPFLYLPRPKEFSATLKAYTYPDAFSSMMGVTEVADGMYLDSQMGDSFDLSYRTRIGNLLAGEEVGYKVHLIYNATVAPTQVSYMTQGEVVNPIEFSWEIQAVPAPIAGYRPTAHVTIDTRHMDDIRWGEIEDLIYGSESTPPSIPDPQVLFDMLNFGDGIIITDHGDGTWSAEGSYRNIYDVNEDVFQIDNVNAVDNGDGTFDISTTSA